MDKPLEIVIVGLGAGGLYASKSALSYSRKCHVTIIEKRDFDQFSPCGLPFVIEGLIEDFEALKYDLPEIKNKLCKLLNHEVVSVDSRSKTVNAVNLSTSDTQTIQYDSLILATGASPINLPIPGAKDLEGKGVHFVSDIDDSKALLDAVRSSKMKRAVVVGGAPRVSRWPWGLRNWDSKWQSQRGPNPHCPGTWTLRWERSLWLIWKVWE